MAQKLEFYEGFVIIDGVGINIDLEYTDQTTGWNTKDVIEAFPYGCKVSLDAEGLVGRKDVGKVVGYWDDCVLVYNPQNEGHSGGSFFEENQHLWKEVYSGKCWWIHFTRVIGVRKI